MAELIGHTDEMLQCRTEQPSKALADFVDLFLIEAPWLRRRVETVAFLDYDTVVRRLTFDVGGQELAEAIKRCPMYEDRPLVPLTLMKKELLVDVSLRDRAGAATPIVPRDVDSFFAWSLLCQKANRVLGEDLVTTHAAIAIRLREMTFNFPDPSDDFYSPYLASWEIPAGWVANDQRAWRALIEDETFSRHLQDFTFNFILMTQLDLKASAHLHLLKLSYQQHLPYSEIDTIEKLGLRSTELDITAPAVGSVRSYHMQVEAPNGVSLTDVVLVRIDRRTSAQPSAAESYEARIGSQSVQIYTTPAIAPAEHVVAVTMRVVVDGYLRSVWLTTLASAVILTTGRFLMNHVEAAAEHSTEAAVALLLVAPSLLAAYLVRPDEHAIASRLLRPIRYCVALAGCLTFAAAASLVLGFPHPPLHTAWTVGSVIACFIAVYITLVVILTKRDIDKARKTSTTSGQRQIVVFPYK